MLNLCPLPLGEERKERAFFVESDFRGIKPGIYKDFLTQIPGLIALIMFRKLLPIGESREAKNPPSHVESELKYKKNRQKAVFVIVFCFSLQRRRCVCTSLK
jgi:hypothetical protein